MRCPPPTDTGWTIPNLYRLLTESRPPATFCRGHVERLYKDGDSMQKVYSFVGVSPQVGARSLFLLAALVSCVLSVVLWCGGHPEQAICSVLRVPPTLP